MNRDEIKNRVRDNLLDEGQVHWEDFDLNTAIQDGYDEVALFTQCIEKVATLTLVSNLTYYKMIDYFSDYYRIVAIWNTDTNRWLEPIAISELNESHPRWETLIGQPAFFTPIGIDYVAITKKPLIATSTLLIFYISTANTLAGSTIPTIPISSHEVLEDYATAILLDQTLEYAKSQRYYENYLRKIV